MNKPMATGMVPSGRGAFDVVVDSLAFDTKSQASCTDYERAGSLVKNEWFLLCRVETSLHGLGELATTNLHFLKSKDSKANSGVPNFGGLLHHWVFQNCRGGQTRKINIGEVDGVNVGKRDLWQVNLWELVHSWKCDFRKRNGGEGETWK